MKIIKTDEAEALRPSPSPSEPRSDLQTDKASEQNKSSDSAPGAWEIAQFDSAVWGD